MKQPQGTITDVETIGSRIKTRRKELGLSQVKLAALAGVSPGTIGNFESGIRGEPRQLLEIAAALAVTPDWLKTGKGEMAIPSHHAGTIRVNDDVHGYTASTQATESIGTRQAVMALSRALMGQDEVMREQAAVLLKHLALQPERAAEFAEKLDDLLGGGGAEASATHRKTG